MRVPRSLLPLLGVCAATLLTVACRSRAFNASTRSAPATDAAPPIEGRPDAGCSRYLDAGQARDFERDGTERAARGEALPVAIVGLNDLHGHVEPSDVALADGAKERRTKVGGVAAMAAYFSALCRRYQGRVLFLDAGDAYQGTLVSNMTEGESIVAAYDALGIHASTFGNHEFDYGQEALRRILARPRSFLYLSANLRDAADKTKLPWEEDRIGRLHKSGVFKIGPVKIGVVGFTTLTTPLKTLPSRVQGLAFVPPLARAGDPERGVVAAEVERLRKVGARYVVLLGHAGGRCDMSKPPEAGESACEAQDDELLAFLTGGGKGLVDAAFAGHSHNAQRHLVGGVPLMQTTGYGRSFSWLHVELVAKAAPDAPLAARAPKVEPRDPVFFCHEHFPGYESCNPKQKEWGGTFPASVFDPKASVAPRFLGEPLAFDSAAARRAGAALAPFLERVRAQQEAVVANLPERLDHDRADESTMGNCYADAARDDVDARARASGGGKRVDLVLMNSGGIRAGLNSGTIRYEDVYAALPFDNAFVGIELSAEELLAYARKVESSPEDLPYLSSPYTARLAKDRTAPRTLAILKDGKPLEAGSRHVVASSEFTAQFAEAVLGKDEFGRRSFAIGSNIRDSFAERLRKAPLPASCRKPTLGRHILVAREQEKP